MKILVVLTGGTIGSFVQDGVINVDSTSSYLLIRKYREKYDSGVEFDVISPLSILSENIRPQDWGTLYKAVSTKLKDGKYRYDGVIVAHGSDTLAYTSAFLGYCFGNTDIPILITASNYELNDERSVGLRNFANCVSYVNQNEKPGVFVLYENNRGVCDIYRSTRLRSADSFCDQFSDFTGIPEGRIDSVGEKVIWNKATYNTSLCDTLECWFDPESVDMIFPKSVMCVYPYPGQNYANIVVGKNIKAVIHYLYHASTASTVGDDESIHGLIEKCKSSGTDMYVSCFKRTDVGLYETGDEIINAGGIPLLNISPEAAYVKCILAYNQKEWNPVEFMKKNIYFESVV